MISFSTASLITRSTNDIQQIQLLTVMILRMVLYAPIMAIGGIWNVFHTNVDMSWIIALAVVLIFLLVAVLFAVVMPKFRILQNLVDRLNLVSREILTGLSVIRAFGTENMRKSGLTMPIRSDPCQSVCKPCHDLYDAGYDVDYEWN